jgi:hypothetical protein
MKSAFQVSPDDNVATLLADADGELVAIVGGKGSTVSVTGNVKMGHKVATAPIAAGDFVIKYGMAIGQATRAIVPGDWVHLHNCASNCDERSSTLDGETGAPTDTIAAYD